MSQRQTFLYEFADFRVDAQRRVLFSRLDGQPLPLTGKVFDTLLYFVEHAGELLDKRTLLEALWPNVVVEESNLTQTIHTLRRTLGERPGEHRFIVTVAGRGYRFVADVTSVDEPSRPAATSHRRAATSHPAVRVLGMLATAIFVLAAVAFVVMRMQSEPQRPASAAPSAPAVAVLPFVDMSEGQNQAYFADGLSEEILNLLAQSSAMRVIARTSSFSFRDRHELDIATIARKLEATHVLEGSVRRSGDRVRITAQLVDGTTSAHLWSQTYDRKVTDIFIVQDDIAAAVADSLNATLNKNGHPQRADTTSEQAFERYLHGRYFFNRRGESDIVLAREYFEQALKIDPNYARAWAGLAGTYYASLDSAQPPAQDAERAWVAAVERGLSLGPSLAEVHVRAAQYYWWLGDARTSDEHCKLAIALNPSDSLVLSVSASKAMSAGHGREAVALQRRAVAVDPLSAPGRATLGVYLAAIGELQEAESQFRHARELSPMLPGISAEIARVLVLQRRFVEAMALTDEMPAGAWREQSLALAHAGMGKGQAADEATVRLIALANAAAANPALQLAVAEIHAFRGNEDLAISWIENALQSAAASGTKAATVWTKHEIRCSPFLDSLNDHARWQSLLASANQQ